MIPINIRLDPDEIERADALIKPVAKAYPWARSIARSSLLRMAILRGLRDIEREMGLEERPVPPAAAKAVDAAIAKVVDAFGGDVAEVKPAGRGAA